MTFSRFSPPSRPHLNSGSCRATVGGCWTRVAEEMDSEAEIHKSVANGIVDEIIKPIKSLVDAQCKAKKQIETNVDKKAKVSAKCKAEKHTGINVDKKPMWVLSAHCKAKKQIETNVDKKAKVSVKGKHNRRQNYHAPAMIPSNCPLIPNAKP